MSPKNAGLAKKLGYTNIRVMLQGLPAWIKAGHPVVSTREFVTKGNIVLIDLRSPKEAAWARIPRSVNIPCDEIDDRIDDIPIKAPVVLYGPCAFDVFEELLDEGFKKVSLVDGSFKDWINTGGPVESGPVVTEIKWKRKLGKGEVSRADFERALKDRHALVLDVRTDTEQAAGHFPNVKGIPLDQLPKRMGELPKNKKIYVHCTTGARAEMAAKELKKNGYDVYFLVAEIECEGTDCTIED